jgi:hypothetical protein
MMSPTPLFRHSREGGNPASSNASGMPALAGMTVDVIASGTTDNAIKETA